MRKRDQVTVVSRSPAFSGIFVLYLSSVYYHLSSVYHYLSLVYHLLVGNNDKKDDKPMIYRSYDDKLMINDDKCTWKHRFWGDLPLE
jgi:hypothetical protein